MRCCCLFCLWMVCLWGENVSLVMGQVPFTCDGNIYMTVVDTSEQVQLYEVKENRQEIAFFPYSELQDYNINAIGYRKTDNFIYGFDPNMHFLYRIDANGVAEEISYIVTEEDYYAGDVTPDGSTLLLLNGNSIAKIWLDNPNTPPEIIYTTTTDSLQSSVACTDVAFHPVTGVLYGYDGVLGKLITIDIETGLIDNTTFKPIDYNNTIPALFFNGVGELKGVATDNVRQDAILFQFDLITGQAARSVSVNIRGDRDACSCPYTTTLEGYFRQSEAYPCTQVPFVIKIANLSNELQTDAHLVLDFPSSLELASVLYHPFADENMVFTERTFEIHDFQIPSGVDSLVLLFEIPEEGVGNHAVQAMLSMTGVLSQVSQTLRSDNPYTFEEKDAAVLEVFDMASDGWNYPSQIEYCGTDSIWLSFPYVSGLEYLWNTGDTSHQIGIADLGTYSLEVRSFCDTNTYTTSLIEPDLEVELGPSLELAYLDKHLLQAELLGGEGLVRYQWSNDADIPISCPTCAEINVQIITDITYTLTVQNENGCTASDDIHIGIVHEIYAPTAFSPNSDGINDLFFVQTLTPALEIYHFKIFDRWGNLVHQSAGQTNDPSIGWDGRYKGTRCKTGVYVWQAIVQTENGSEIPLHGDVLLVY